MSCPNCGIQLAPCRPPLVTTTNYTLPTVPDFDAQIIQADELLENLRQQRYSLLRQRNCHTPILSLPEEILQKIMAIAIESEQEEEPAAPEAAVQYRSLAKPPPPKFNALFFGKICSAWRDIAWKTSELWSTPHVTLRQNTNDLHTELLQQWLDRANQRTLAVKLKADPNGCHRSSSVLPLLVSRSKHWTSIDISTPQWLSVLNHVRDQLPILTSVSVRCTIYAREQPITVFETAPQLTKADIALTTFGGTGSLVKIHLPWSNLTDLKARWFSMDECIEVLRRATNLVDCEFSDIGPVKNLYPIPQELVQVEDLESLKVHFQPEVAASPFFQWISLPSLILLDVDARNMVPFRAVTELVGRSSCRLLRAKLEGPMQSEQDLIEFLEKMPTLIELSIHEHRENVISTNFLRELKPTKARCSPLRQRVAPKLEVLQYRDRARVLFP